jgi:DNA-binding NarL/FixJ family response regulator
MESLRDPARAGEGGGPPASHGPVAPRVLRVLLVDDHDFFRTGLRALLQEESLKVDDVSDGEAAIEACRSFRPDVVIMDMNMPGMSGIEATRLLTTEHPRLAVLMLTVAVDDRGVLAAIRAGASGYLVKDARLPEIIAGIRAAAEGESVVASRVAGVLVDSVREGLIAAPATAADRSPALTTRERQVLMLLAEGLDNGEIADRLYVSISTVKNHVSSLLEKLEVDNRVQAAVFAIRSGVLDGS